MVKRGDDDTIIASTVVEQSKRCNFEDSVGLTCVIFLGKPGTIITSTAVARVTGMTTSILSLHTANLQLSTTP